MSEVALITARNSRLENAAKKGNRAAKAALRLVGEPERFVSTIQIGITLISIFTGLYSGEAWAGDLSAQLTAIGIPAAYSFSVAKILIVVGVTYFTLVFGELVPKRIGMNAPEQIALLVVHPINLFSRMMTPFVWLLVESTKIIVRLISTHSTQENKVTEEEIKDIIREGTNNGEIQKTEQYIVEHVFNLGDRNIASIMTHRSELVWLEINESTESLRNKIKQDVYNVYPVAEAKLDQTIGVVFLKDLFGKIDSPDFCLSDLLHSPKFIPESQSVYKALEGMKNEHVGYGIVTDEFGSINGIVTLKDIINVLLGEVTEKQEEAEIIPREDGTLLVDGQCSFYKLLEYLELECLYPDYEHNTISGLILHLLEHIPHTGEKVTWHGLILEIVDMDGARIDKILVSKK